MSTQKLAQAQDFMHESNELYALVHKLSDAQLDQVTAFKHWTINDIISHLHIWNLAADLSLKEPDAFYNFFAHVDAAFKSGKGLKEFEREYLPDKGRGLVNLWRVTTLKVGEHFSNADPKARVKWAGPDMSVRSSITARLMETWAHGQAIYDLLGVVRENTDRIQNIVVLGINTFQYTYKVRGEAVPDAIPCVKLTAPSGALWRYGDEGEADSVEGLAEEFCQVVTQTRNIADTQLKVKGAIATDWMSKAQCFAGGAESPPVAGSRTIKIV